MRSTTLSIDTLHNVRTNVRFLPNRTDSLAARSHQIYSRTLGSYVVVDRSYAGPKPKPYEWWEVALKLQLSTRLITADPIVNLSNTELYFFVPTAENCTIIRQDNMIYIKPIVTDEIYGKALALDGVWKHQQPKPTPCNYVLVNCDYNGDKDVLSKDVSA